MVADRLYGGATPVLTLEAGDYRQLGTGAMVEIARDGSVTR